MTLDRTHQRGIPFGVTPVIVQEVLQGAKTEKDFSVLRKYLDGVRCYLPGNPRAAAIEHGLYLLHGDRDYDRIASVFPLKIFHGLLHVETPTIPDGAVSARP